MSLLAKRLAKFLTEDQIASIPLALREVFGGRNWDEKLLGGWEIRTKESDDKWFDLVDDNGNILNRCAHQFYGVRYVVEIDDYDDGCGLEAHIWVSGDASDYKNPFETNDNDEVAATTFYIMKLERLMPDDLPGFISMVVQFLSANEDECLRSDPCMDVANRLTEFVRGKYPDVTKLDIDVQFDYMD